MKMDENGPTVPEQSNTQINRESRVRHVKDRQNEERQRKLEDIKAQALAAQIFKEQREQERRRRLEEMRNRDDDRRQQVEERKRAINEAERDRLEFILKRNQDRESLIERKKKNDRSNVVFAFGSSTPRMLEPTDSSISYWGSRRATSIQNINSSTILQSEKDVDVGSKKRASSATGLERTGTIPAGCVSGYIGRRRTDLVPTILSKDSTTAVHTSQKPGPGRAYSMTRLDQLAQPRRRNDMHLSTNANSARNLAQSDSRSMQQLNDRHNLGRPRANRTTQMREQRLLASSNCSEASSRPSSSLSQRSTNSVASSASVRRVNASSRKARPVSIAITGVTHELKVDSIKPPLPKKPSRAKTPEEGSIKEEVTSNRTQKPVVVNGKVESVVEIANEGRIGNNKKATVEVKREIRKEQLLVKKHSSDNETIHGKTGTLNANINVRKRSNDITLFSKEKQKSLENPPEPTKTEPQYSGNSAQSTEEILYSIEVANQIETPVKNKDSITLTEQSPQPSEHRPDPPENISPPMKTIPVSTENEKTLTSTKKIHAIQVTQEIETPLKFIEIVPPPTEKLLQMAEEKSEHVEITPQSSQIIPQPPEKIPHQSEKSELSKISNFTEIAQQTVLSLKTDTTFLQVRENSLQPSEKLLETTEKISVTDINETQLHPDIDEMTLSMTKSRITTEKEAKAALAEKRRLIREEAERQAELERLRVEAEAKAELERQQQEEEQLRQLIELQRQNEQERLQEAIREAQKREEEERIKREEEQKMKLLKDEAEKRAKEEAERQKAELQERLKNEEKEREARRKRVEAIMLRTRGKNNANLTSPNSDEKNGNRSEVINDSIDIEKRENGTTKIAKDIVDNL